MSEGSIPSTPKFFRFLNLIFEVGLVDVLAPLFAAGFIPFVCMVLSVDTQTALS